METGAGVGVAMSVGLGITRGVDVSFWSGGITVAVGPSGRSWDSVGEAMELVAGLWDTRQAWLDRARTKRRGSKTLRGEGFIVETMVIGSAP